MILFSRSTYSLFPAGRLEKDCPKIEAGEWENELTQTIREGGLGGGSKGGGQAEAARFIVKVSSSL